MTFGNPFGGGFGAGALDASSWSDAGPDMNPDLRARILALLSQQPQEGEVPDATPPGFSGFNPPDAPTNTAGLRLGGALAADPSLQSLPLPPSMGLASPRGMPAEPQGPLLNGTLDAPQVAPPAGPGPQAQLTGPANSVSRSDASPLASMPTLLGMKPPAMPTAAKPETPDAGDGEDTPPNAGVSAPRAPTTYTGLPGDKPVAAPNAVPGAPAPAVSAPPAGSLLATAPGSTAAPAAPSKPANAAPAVAEPSIWKRLADAGIGDQMIALGAGIAGGKNLGEGLSAGFDNVSRVGMTQAATNLANAKAQREQAQLLGNAALYKKFMPNATDQEAMAAGSNSQIMTELLKRGLPPTETYRTEVDEKGNQWQVNSQNNQRTLLKAADEDKTVTPVPDDERQRLGLPPGLYQRDANGKIGTVAAAPERVSVLSDAERQQLGLPPGAYQRDSTGKVSAIGGGGVNIVNQAESAEASTVGKALGEEKANAIAADKSARDRIALVHRMNAGLDAAGDNITTGPGAESVLGIKRFVSNIIGHELPGTSATEVFANAGPTLAGEAAKAITARPAIVEFQAMMNSKPGLANTLEGNRAMLDLIRQGAEHDIEIARIARSTKPGEDFGAKVDQYNADHPYINPFTKQPMDGRSLQQGGASGASPAAPQAAAPAATPNARVINNRTYIRGPDGAWYTGGQQ